MQITRSNATIARAPRPFLQCNRSESKGDESDSLTIEGLKRHDPGAMTVLYDRYGRLVYSVVCRIVGKGGEAEEIVQETFLRVWTRIHLIDDSCNTLSPWLFIIARNLAIDYLRSANGRNRRFKRCEYEFVPAPVTLDHFSDHAEQLRRAFGNLSLEQRTVIKFAYFEGLTQTEIADRMKKPLGTVKTWTRTALGNLRKSFAVSVGVPATSRTNNGKRVGC